MQAAFGQNLPKGIVFTTEPQQEYYNQTILRRFQELVTKNFAGVLGLGLWLMLVTVGISGYFAMLLNIRSIGIKRSLGASKRTIFYFFVRSGLYTGLIGGGGGLVCAWFVRSLGQRLDVEQPVFGWLTVSITLVAAVVISTASYILTGVYAMNLPPSVAMRERIGKTLAGRRWLLGGSSIAVGLLALILILGLRSGLAARMDEILGWTGARTISAISWSSTSDPLNQPAYLTNKDYEAVQNAFPTWTVGWRRIPIYTAIESSANIAQIQPIQLACGRWITPEEETAKKAVLVLGYERAVQVAKQRKINSICDLKQWRNLPVVGILASLDQWPTMIAQGFSPLAAYVPIGSKIVPSIDDPNTMWDYNAMRLIDGEIIVSVPENEDLGQAAERLRAFLAPRHPEGVPQLILPAGVTNDLLARRNQIYTLAGVMAGLCLLIGGVGLMNLTFISVLSRAREIGIRRAVGATRRAQSALANMIWRR